MRWFAVLPFLLAGLPAIADSPLFESSDSIALTIEAPMRELIRKRRSKPQFDATVTYTDANGESRSVSARIETRGNHRLETCTIPPIRLEFDKDSIAGTLFEGQKKLKVVTPCDRGNDNETWLRQEFGIYRALNEITDYSYRVRMLELSYRDVDSKRWKREYPAFFIEAHKAVAARHGLTNIRPPTIRPDQFDASQLMNVMLFQYLVANTDFSVLKGPSGEGCCHNGRVFSARGAETGWKVIPYDFDQAGIIDTDYALPDKRLRIRAVRSRLYRGFCWNNEELPGAIERFNLGREAITAALVPEGISSSKQRSARRYVDRFYEIINDPEELQDNILDKCRGAASFEIRETTSAGQ